MPSIRRKTTKTGRDYYEITVSRGRSQSRLFSRWYVPEGWSQRAIDRELAKVAAEFERQCKAGEIVSRKEKRQQAALEAAEAAKIQTLYQYGERVFMPAKAVMLAENSRSGYQGILDRWIYPALGDRKLPEITAAEITSFLLSLQSQGRAASSVTKTYNILHGLFSMAYLSDTIDRNPMDKVAKPLPKKGEAERKKVNALTVPELQTVMAALEREPLQWRALIHFMIDTGARRGECCGLRWEDVNLSECSALICRNLCYTPEKGVYIDSPKNGRSRIVSISAETASLLDALRAESYGAGFVFTRENGIDPIHPQSPTKFLEKLSKKCGIPNLHPHKLRHTFASIAITAGADVASVSEALGHSDKAVTLRMYTHADAESRKRAAQIFQNAISQNLAKSRE